ncbi:MAG: CDP-alcohol phosphatidyltransferase family protein [Oscillospiraceae bacterium]|nr:CDP-alcohol phosphatidyltransferase family protein [Oscillospiraceae bacterium]
MSVLLLLIQAEFDNRELIAVALIVFGTILDFLDGYLARKLNAVSENGKQLDSFADLITFGIAPICLIFYSSLCGHSIVSLIAITGGCAIYVIAGAYRLARFNLSDDTGFYKGLPITIAGGVLSLYCVALFYFAREQHSSFFLIFTIVILILLSLLMVCKFRIKKL